MRASHDGEGKVEERGHPEGESLGKRKRKRARGNEKK